MKLTEQEIQQIETARKETEQREKCTAEILQILDKYDYQLNVDMNSSIGNPIIILNKKT